jgi:LacI family repressor for deo operon, udp, cdd, tsx, nupC, and nupG
MDVILFINHVKLYIGAKSGNSQGAQLQGTLPMTRPTIEDVARLASVSIATVSRCLHTPDRVAQATRDRVLTAVRETGYNLNAAAQSLRQRRANTVLVVVPDIGNTFFSEILGGIEAEASAAGLTMLIGNTARQRAREDVFVRYLLNGRADGALLLAAPEAAWFDVPRTNALGVRPIVTISEVVPEPDTPAVMIDNETAAHDAVAHLIGRGHRRIAHVTGPAANILTAQRTAGYRRALAEAGLPWEPGMEYPGDFTLSCGREGFLRFLAADPRPTAIFCANDESAMGFIAAAHRAGVAVPRDVSVLGFDDIHFAQAFIPALTTIRQPRAEMGAAALRLLVAIMNDAAPATVRLAHELILRDSTADAR